jgi:hypothetical protein
MAVFLCHHCTITIVENRAGEKPKCPRCKKEMIPKAGPGSIEEQFPDRSPDETVFRVDFKDLPPSIDPVKRQEPKQ